MQFHRGENLIYGIVKKFLRFTLQVLAQNRCMPLIWKVHCKFQYIIGYV